jgi:hypothetical protein
MSAIPSPSESGTITIAIVVAAPVHVAVFATTERLPPVEAATSVIELVVDVPVHPVGVVHV